MAENGEGPVLRWEDDGRERQAIRAAVAILEGPVVGKGAAARVSRRIAPVAELSGDLCLGELDEPRRIGIGRGGVIRQAAERPAEAETAGAGR